MADTEKPEAQPATGLVPAESPPETVQTGYQPDISGLLKKSHVETANKLAGWLLAILGGTVLIHYTCVMVLIFTGHTDGATILEDLFHSWLPVLSGLAGAAVTYYFTKDGK